MTKQEFINNFNINDKLKNFKYLKDLSFDNWFFNIYGPHLEQIILNKGAEISLAEDFNFFEEYYFNKKKIINEKDSIHLNRLYSRYINNYNDRLKRIEKEVKNFYEDLEYFCEEPNLDFLEWLDKYYVPNLMKIPEEEMTDEWKKERLLRVDVFKGKLDEKEFLLKMKHDPTEGYQSKDYIEYDYKIYLDTQITRPTISWIE
jgi:hypothetical protein